MDPALLGAACTEGGLVTSWPEASDSSASTLLGEQHLKLVPVYFDQPIDCLIADEKADAVGAIQGRLAGRVFPVAVDAPRLSAIFPGVVRRERREWLDYLAARATFHFEFHTTRP